MGTAVKPTFWNNSVGSILLLVLSCEVLMEGGSHLILMRFASDLLAHMVMLVVVAIIGVLAGSRILAAQKRFRKRLEDEIRAAGEWQLKMSDSARQLAEALDEVKSHNQRLLCFSEFTHALMSCSTEAEINDCIPRFAPSLFPETLGGLYRPDSGQMWRAACHWPDNNGLPKFLRMDIATENTAIAANEVIAALRVGVQSRPSWSLPITLEKELLAIIYIELLVRSRDDANEIESLAKACSGEIRLAYSNLRLRKELGQQAIRDALTGLFNRRYMEEALSREVKRAERQRSLLSVLMIDLDHFKQLNDQFGHDCGDAVLKGLGGTILSSSREEDIACRYGGEEVLVVLPNTAIEGAVNKAQRLRANIKKLAALTKYRREVTASIGVATYPQNGLTAAALIKSADLALYTAKRQGRDRVCRANEVVRRIEITDFGNAVSENSI